MKISEISELTNIPANTIRAYDLAGIWCVVLDWDSYSEGKEQSH